MRQMGLTAKQLYLDNYTEEPLVHGDGAYVYFLVRDDTDEIVYVGKGRGKRRFHHMRDYKNGVIRGVKKHEGIRLLLDTGVTISPRLYMTGLEDDSALEIERDLIKSIGRKSLLNSCGSRGHPMKRLLEQTISYRAMLHPSHKGTPIYEQVIAEFDEVIDICMKALVKDETHGSA